MHCKIQKTCFIISMCQQGCFKGHSAKEAVIMDSFVELFEKIHGNIKAYFFRTFILMPTSYTNAVFRTSRFCLKINAILNDAIEISFILRISFVNMFLNLQILPRMKFWAKYAHKIKLQQHKKTFSFLQSKWGKLNHLWRGISLSMCCSRIIGQLPSG